MTTANASWSLRSLLTRPAHSNWTSVIVWWEIRRLLYNLIMAPIGMFAVLSSFLLAILADPNGEGIELYYPIVMPVLGAIFFNMCYTAGWVAELLLRAIMRDSERSIGPALFVAGLLLSIAIALTPTIFLGIYDAVKYSRLALTGE